MLIPQWALDRASSMSLLDAERLLGESSQISGVVGEVRSAVTRLSEALSNSSISARQKMALIAALLYLVCFWDLIPDFGPLGWTDDLAVIRMALMTVSDRS